MNSDLLIFGQWLRKRNAQQSKIVFGYQPYFMTNQLGRCDAGIRQGSGNTSLECPKTSSFVILGPVESCSHGSQASMCLLRIFSRNVLTSSTENNSNIGLRTFSPSMVLTLNIQNRFYCLTNIHIKKTCCCCRTANNSMSFGNIPSTHFLCSL